MNSNAYPENIGRVVLRLQALEFTLRMFLCAAYNEPIEVPVRGTHSITETHLTNYDSLDELIKKYNQGLVDLEKQWSVDSSIVQIRNAFAHGRALDQSPIGVDGDIRLFKFSRPKKGVVQLEFDELLTAEWLTERKHLLRDQISKVTSCAKERRYRIFTG